MIVGRFDVPNVGECSLERIKLTRDPKGSLLFELSSGPGDNVGFFSLGQAFDEKGKATSDRELVHFDVYEQFRGRKVGSFLAGQAVAASRRLGAGNLITYAANERTVSSVARNVDVERATFKITDNKGDIAPDTEPISVEEALEFLQAERLRQFPDDPDSSEILENGATVYIRAPILSA